MGFMEAAAKKNQSRKGRGHDSAGEAAKRRFDQSKAGQKVANTQEKTGKISEAAKRAAGKTSPCASPKCNKKTNGWVCSPKCSKEAAKGF